MSVVKQKGPFTVFNRFKTTVVLSPSGIEVLRTDRSGGVVSRTERTLEPAVIEQAWASGLGSLDGALTALLRAAEVPRGSSARVVYQGSDEIVEIRTFDAGSKGIEQVAEAKLLHELGYSAELASFSTARIHSDAFPDQAVVVCAADRDDRINALHAWLRRCGLKPIAAVPSDALAIVEAFAAVERTLCERPASERAVLWWIGAWSCVLVVASPESESGTRHLELVRSMRCGVDGLADAMASALNRNLGAGDQEVGIDRAWEVVRAVGVPHPDAIVEPQTNCTGRDVLPMLQPALQRMTIEVKQTLRFGVNLTLVPPILLSGPGGILPGMAATMGGLLDAQVTSVADESEGVPVPANGSEVGHLMPRAVTAKRDAGRFVAAARLGGVAAALVLGASAYRAISQHQGIDQQIAAFQPQVDRVQRIVVAEQSASELRERVSAVELALRDVVGQDPAWEGLLIEIDSLCTDSVRLLGLAADGGSGLELRGLVADETDGSGREQLAAFLSRLSDNPLIRDVQLESTRRAEFRGAAGRRFVIRVQPIALPARTEIVTSAGGSSLEGSGG